MEIKSIPEIIKEMDTFVRQERYDEAYQFAKEKGKKDMMKPISLQRKTSI